ncbi:MAG: ATP-dependent sacrificial sulfur transferase LarE [Candidatus Hermodarchaeota archaeon]
MEISNTLEEKLDNLISFLKEFRIIIAFSGGLDSSLLAYLTKKYSKDMLAITIESELNPDEEVSKAKKFAELYEIPLSILKKEPLKNDLFIENPINRCYICKKDIFSSILQIKEEKNFDIVIDGSNVDDLGDYRPGLDALKELNIISPYLKFKINKKEIRELSDFFNLPTSNKASGACLASRIPYNENITEKKLLMIRQAESYLKNTYDLQQLRVRLHEGFLARIELLTEDIPIILNKADISRINKEFKNLGFCYVTIDLEGYRSGSLNEAINK